MSSPTVYEMAKTWSGSIEAADKCTNAVALDCFARAKNELVANILKYVNEENRLTKYDEKIFEYYKHLMWHYYQTIHVYNETKHLINTRSIREILDGICSVLSSQLKQFEESQEHEYANSDKRYSHNPIKREKDYLVNEISASFKRQIGECESKFLKENRSKLRNIMREFFAGEYGTCENDSKTEGVNSRRAAFVKFQQRIFDLMASTTGERVCELFVAAQQECAEKLSNLQVRKAAHFYYESIVQEKENLSLIIKIQVVALEKEMTRKNIQLEEQQVVQKILGTLREGHQYLGKEITELVDYFKEAEVKGKVVVQVDHNAFYQYIDKLRSNYLNWSVYPQDIEEYLIDWSVNFERFNCLFAQEVDDTINNIINRYTPAKSIYDYKKLIVENEMLTTELIRCFAEIAEFYDVYKEQLIVSDCVGIVEGINETMHIKVDSLKENSMLFIESAEELLNSLRVEPAEISWEQRDQIQKMMSDTWFELMFNVNLPLEERYFTVLVEKVMGKVEMLDVITGFKEVMRKGNDIGSGVIEKKVQQYLKNQLLFEISTFEEIINYSVTKLRESSNESVQYYTQEIDLVSADIFNILNKYYIERIKPEVGAIFNGKEHEVMMAEKSEGFKKGQIIKVMNSGFRVNGNVLIRANIIAAR